MKKSLYQACKEFVNSVGVGNEFKSTDYTSSTAEFGNVTNWCRWNNNPHYRAHTYKTFFHNIGIISQVKHGVWKVNYLIPENVTLTDFKYASGYTHEHKMNAETRIWASTVIKKNPFDFKAYFTSCDNAMDNVMSSETPVEVDEMSKTKKVYSVNMKTGEIMPMDIMKFDNSFKSLPNVFEDEDSAQAFAEGLVFTMSPIDDDLLDSALESIENDIAETLLSEGDPSTNPEFSSAEEIIPGAQFVDILIPVGTTVYVVTKNDDEVLFSKEVVDEVEIEISTDGVNYEFECISGYEFTKHDLGVKVFTDKSAAVKILTELV